MGAPNNVVPVPVVPPPNSEAVVVLSPVDEAGSVFRNILPPLPNRAGSGVDGFPPSGSPEVVAEVGLLNRPPPGADVVVVVPSVGIVVVAPKSVPLGLEPKMFPGAVVIIPVPIVPVPMAGVEVCVLLV